MLRRAAVLCFEKRSIPPYGGVGLHPRRQPSSILKPGDRNVREGKSTVLLRRPSMSPMVSGELLYSGEEEDDATGYAVAASHRHTPVMTRANSRRPAESRSLHMEEGRDVALSGEPHDEVIGEASEDGLTSPLRGEFLHDEGDGELPPDSGKSSEAYRFLLHHIDAEIAALQRRHVAVTTRRQKVEDTQAHRIKELFEFMESPWLLLEPDMPPALPATGVDVYLKEQRAKRRPPGDHSHTKHLHDASDKMFVLACHKNYRNLAAAQKKPYEVAAQHNAMLRQELRYRLATGCSRFEAFFGQIRECTAEMVRKGQVPDLPAVHHSHTTRGRGPSGPSAASHRSSAAALTNSKSRSPTNARRKDIQSTEKAEAVDSLSMDGEEDSLEGYKEEEEIPAPKRGRGGQQGGVARPVVRHAKKATKGSRAPKEAFKPTTSTAAATPKKSSKAKASVTAPRGRKPSAVKRGDKVAAAAKPSRGGVSSSIPLPNLNALAIRKLQRVAAVSGGKKTVKGPAKKRGGRR